MAGTFYVLRHNEIDDDGNAVARYSFTVDDGAYAPNPKTHGQDYVQVFLKKIFDELAEKAKKTGEGGLILPPLEPPKQPDDLEDESADRFGAIIYE